jgi:SNF2 family DNA or RNA helicase
MKVDMDQLPQSELNWLRVDDCIYIRDSIGALIRPTAMDIYLSAFRGKVDFNGVRTANSVRDADPALDFSRGAAPIACLLDDSPDGPVASVGVLVGEVAAPIGLGQDQIIVDNCWYPIEVSGAAAIAETLETRGVPLSVPMSFGAYVELRLASGQMLHVVDRVTASSLHTTEPVKHLSQVSAVLFPYQLAGVGYLNFVARQELGCILADEMGLGKTIQVLALLNELKCEGGGPFLIVCPSSLLENWRREAAQFTPGLSITIHSGSMRAGIASMLGRENLTVVSYDTLVRDSEIFSKKTWHAVILDEAQAIKNSSSQRAVAISMLKRRVSIAVTGTPLENRLEDVWSLMSFAAPHVLGEKDVFLEKYDRDGASEELARLIAPLVLRRRVADVADDLPHRVEVSQYLLMPPTMAARYEEVRRRALAEFEGAGSLVALTRLRALCAEVTSIDDSRHEGDVKFERLVAILEEAFSAREKVLIFSSFRRTADGLLERLAASFPGFFSVIDGRVNPAGRQEIIDAFFLHSGPGALMLNPRAAGAGLNITAANHVVHYNPEWNPALTAQASARAYRRRQSKVVTIHHLIFANTVEDAIRDVSKAKAALADVVVEGTSGLVSRSMLAEALALSPLVNPL